MHDITFQINYHTTWGQKVVVVGNLPELGEWKYEAALGLEHTGEGNWTGNVSLQNAANLQYHYAVLDEYGQVNDVEWRRDRRVCQLDLTLSSIWIRDAWTIRHHPENVLYNTAFLGVLFRQPSFPAIDKVGVRRLVFQISVPRVEQGCQLCLLGNLPELGGWDPASPVLMNNADYPKWQGQISIPARAIVEYKYGLYDTSLGKVIQLEEGGNRMINTYPWQEFDQVTISDNYFRYPDEGWKGTGIAVPVFSLRTKSSFGVGSFSDLKNLIDWSTKLGVKMVQILPVNDTMATGTWLDSSPYSAISVFALHPLYLDVTKINGFANSVDVSEFEERQKKLNDLAEVDYDQVIKWKLSYTRQIFQKEKNRFEKSRSFEKFKSDNKYWLAAYTAFSHLRDRFKSIDFEKWDDLFALFSPSTIEELLGNAVAREECLFYAFLQFYLDRQLREAKEYAQEKGVILKGDIAIGVFRYSADTWTHRDQFYLNRQAGAPPDAFSQLGQNWGLPPYDWAQMAKDNYRWWRQRLLHFAKYFDAYRVDHILGFFRLWQIPTQQVQGLLGFFSPALPVTLDEFKQRNIGFDRVRFCEPYITGKILRQLFGGDVEKIKKRFFIETEKSRYRFKNSYDTQYKITKYLAKKNNEILQPYKDMLLSLHAEVLFIEEHAERGKVFHPRIDFQNTFSFRALQKATRDKLNELYYDYFYHRQETYWEQLGRLKLPVLREASDMLICGEDLGMIPQCVPKVMQDLDILTLEIERMPKVPGRSYAMRQDIPYDSVASTSSHDMLPLRAWWEQLNHKQKEEYYDKVLGLEGTPPQTCNSQLAKIIIGRHLGWPSIWVVLPVQDILALSDKLKLADPMQERINIPGVTRHYWRYRMHLDLEELTENDDFNQPFREMLKEYGR
jgi:4-alpha-glucanotransferase